MPADVFARHRPKSPIFSVPSREKKMFDGCIGINNRELTYRSNYDEDNAKKM